MQSKVHFNMNYSRIFFSCLRRYANIHVLDNLKTLEEGKLSTLPTARRKNKGIVTKFQHGSARTHA